MLAAEPYIDTSALANRYVDEAGSDEFDAFLGHSRCALLSRLALVELRCMLRRRQRAGEIDPAYERTALADFADDVSRGFFRVEPLADHHAIMAYDLISQLRDHPLRTLDAIHLAVARGAGVSLLATADHAMARAAEALGIEVATF